MRQSRSLRLDQIVGRSPYNVRPEGDPAGRPAMAASLLAVGQLQALIVRPSHRAGTYEIDDGGCRWDAMRLLVERGAWPEHAAVDVLEVQGDGTRKSSLAANVVRRQLHPVEEFEAYAALVRDGVSIEAVAADFGLSARTVRQRLKLDELSPRVRAAWRDGTLSAEAAQVLTGCADHGAQDAILDRHPKGIGEHHLQHLRATLRGRAEPADFPEARYVGLDAYLAAGGQIDENLFDAHPLILDPALMRRLARQRMLDEALPLLTRYGYGSAVVAAELEDRHAWGRLRPLYTAEDEADLARCDADEVAWGEETGEIALRRETIEQRAIERGSTAAERAAAVVCLSLSRDGELLTDLGRTPPPAKPEPPPARKPAARPFAATAAAPSGDEPAKPPGKGLVTVLDEAMSRAYGALVEERPNLAMLLVTVALTAARNSSAVRIETRVPAGDRADADVDPPPDFCTAATAALDGVRTHDELRARFAAAVARTIVVAPRQSHAGARHDLTDAAALAALLIYGGGDAYEPAMAKALDYPAYFAAAARAPTLAAIEAAGGDVIAARKLGREALAQGAAILCRDRGWLPAELRRPAADTLRGAVDAPLPGATLADAMMAALDADGAGEDPAEVATVERIRLPEDALREFVERCCRREGSARVKAADLYAAFRAQAGAADLAAISTMQAFGSLIADLGFAKRRFSNGIHYLDLALEAEVVQAAAE